MLEKNAITTEYRPTARFEGMTDNEVIQATRLAREIRAHVRDIKRGEAPKVIAAALGFAMVREASGHVEWGGIPQDLEKELLSPYISECVQLGWDMNDMIADQNPSDVFAYYIETDSEPGTACSKGPYRSRKEAAQAAQYGFDLTPQEVQSLMRSGVVCLRDGGMIQVR